MIRALLALALVAAAAAPAAALAPVTDVRVTAPANDDGRHLDIAFTRAAGDLTGVSTVVLRRPHTPGPNDPIRLPAMGGLTPGSQVGTWTVVALLESGETSLRDEVDPAGRFDYAVVEFRRDGDGIVADHSAAEAFLGVRPAAAWFHTGRWGFLVIVASIAALIFAYATIARRRKGDLYVRRLPGVDAIEDSIGRSTEMGRPVLYVTGIEEIQNIQTIASLLILSHVAEKTAQYDTDLKVANYFPLTMVVAEEVVRQGYINAGRADAHRPENVLFITAEQFAFAAGVNGIILRERPATNIYFGTFYGESLLLAETGFVTGAVQIAGTAELTQLPFFITACDYTLIGEELYAASAYLTREPTLLANLKAADAFKIAAMLFIVTGVVLATAGVYDLAPKVFP